MRIPKAPVLVGAATLALSACGDTYSRADLRTAGRSYQAASGLELSPAYAGDWNTLYSYLPPTNAATGVVEDIRGLVDASGSMWITNPVAGGQTKIVSNLPTALIPSAIEFTNAPVVPLVYLQQAFNEILPILDATLTPAKAVAMFQAAQPELFQVKTSVPAPANDPFTTALYTSLGTAWSHLASSDPAYGAGGGNLAVSISCASCHASEIPVTVATAAGTTTFPFLQFGKRQVFASADPAGYTRQQLQAALATWLAAGCVPGNQPAIASLVAQQEYCAAKGFANEAYLSSLNFLQAQGDALNLYQGDANSVVGLAGYLIAMFNASSAWRDMSQASQVDSQINSQPVLTSAYRPGGLYYNLMASLSAKYGPNGHLNIPPNRGRVWAPVYSTAQGMNLGTTATSKSFKYNYFTLATTIFGPTSASNQTFQAQYLDGATRTVIPEPSELLFTSPSKYGFTSLAQMIATVADRRLDGVDQTASSAASIPGAATNVVTNFFSAMNQAQAYPLALLKALNQPIVTAQSLSAMQTSFNNNCASCHGTLSGQGLTTVGAPSSLVEALPAAAVTSINPFISDVMSGIGGLRAAPGTLQIPNVSLETVSFGNYSTDSSRIGGVRPTDPIIASSPMADGQSCAGSLADIATNPPGQRVGAYVWVNNAAPWTSGGSTFGLAQTVYTWSTAPSSANDSLYGPALYEANQAHPQIPALSSADASNVCNLLSAASLGGILVADTISTAGADLISILANYGDDSSGSGMGGSTTGMGGGSTTGMGGGSTTGMGGGSTTGTGGGSTTGTGGTGTGTTGMGGTGTGTTGMGGMGTGTTGMGGTGTGTTGIPM